MSKKTDNPKNQRIQVFARCRPLNSFEKRQCSPSVVEVIPERKEILLKDRNTSREFFFDKVFPPDAKQITVYKAVVGPLIQEVLNGYNCTVFAYGQTGTGKTYTMEGERNNSKCSWEDDPGAGIIPRSLHQLFEELNKEENVEFSVRVSFLELYNEELFDLLSSTELSRLRLYEDSNRKGSVIIHGLEEIMVNNKDEVYAILEKGTARRQTAATMLNATSSRSHTVFSVTVHIKENTVEGEELLKTGKLNLVDLAGSENVGRSGAIDKRAREAGNINQSLLTLGRVITALIEKQPHIPYRESKLTRLLQDSLGGHTKTSIIATISPALCNFDETISTLDYATKAKSITIRPEVNQKMTKRALIREYTEEIERLRRDLIALRNKEGFFIDSDNYMSLVNSITEKENKVKELDEKIEVLKEENKKIEELFNITKEELMKTSEQLSETVQKYEETASELSSTTDALVYTQDVLTKTTLDRDEKEYLINVQKKTEGKLTQQAQMLLQVANETTDDVNKLHEKINRKKMVEKINENNYQDFKAMHQKQYAKLDDIITDDKEREICFLQSVKGDIDHVMRDFLEYKQKLSTFLQDISASAELSLHNFSSNLYKETSNQEQWASTVLDNMSSKKDELVLSQQKFMTEKLPSFFAQLDVVNARVFNLFQNNFDKICQKINKHKNTVEAQVAKEKDLLCSMNNTLGSFFENHMAVVDDLMKHSDSVLHSEKESEMKVKKIAADLQKNLADLNSYIKMKEAKADLLQFKEYKQKLNDVVEDIKPVQETINMLRKNKEEDDLSEFTDMINCINMEEISAMKKVVQESQSSVSSDIAGIWDSSIKKQIESYEELKKSFELHDSVLRETSQHNQDGINNITSSLSKKISMANCCIEESSKSLKNVTDEVSYKISESEKQRNQITSQIKKEILNLDLRLEKFVSEDIVKDIATGKTPQRKTFSYPTELVATSPLNRVLQRFRSQRAIDIDLAVNLPLDSSFNESEESKDVTPESIDNGVNSHNASFTSEDCDFDGCETDSNASSVSDSVESGKNKENKVKKTSRLPKKLPKFTGFAKPILPTARKPLISTNSDMDSSTI
ncbi:kinesin-like protein KIF11-A [Nephila pilipes]|uniref:Kinesin-like protein KIF11-A n=1 Tax=Nephila pilipes TaxID=299642 RepID=A0A8X6QHF5_NEPPI|nr:kinesin-like protein KIF11-A [Nephila pilipes]